MSVENELHNSKVIRTFIGLLKEKYPTVDVDTLLQTCKIHREQIIDPDVWFTQEQVYHFHNKLVEMTGNQKIAEEAGRYALTAESKNMGIFSSYLLSLGSPAIIYKNAAQFSEKIDRSTKYKTKKKEKNTYEIIAKPEEGVETYPYQCENRIGNIMQVPEFCGYELDKFDHPECIHRDDGVCRYVVSWKESKSRRWRIIRDLSIALTVTLIAIFLTFYPNYSGLTFSLITVIIFLCTSWYSEIIFKNEVLNELSKKVDLESEYNKLLNESSAIFEISRINKEIGDAVKVSSRLDNTLKAVLKVIKIHLDYDKGLILLKDSDKNRLEYKDGFGYSDIDLNELRTAEFYYDRPKQYEVAFISAFKDKKTFVENNMKSINLLSLDDKLASILTSKTLICCPIIYKEEPMGVLSVFHTTKKRELMQRDINLLEGIAPTIGLVIHNALRQEI